MWKVLSVRRQFSNSLRQDYKLRLQFQEQRFSQLLKQAQKYPFWQKRLQGNESLEDLKQIPILDKKILMDHFDEILCPHGISQKNLKQFFSTSGSAQQTETGHFALRTSGTSGQITCVVLDKADAQRMLAGSMVFATVPFNLQQLVRSLTGNRMRIASIILVEGHFPGTFYAHMSAKLFRVMKLVANPQIVDIAQPIHDITSSLNQMKPDIWVTYPSMLRVLVQQVKMGELKSLPRHLICTSEPLDTVTREMAAEYLKCEPLQVYGSGECPMIASSCSQHKLHIHPEVCVLENVDENDQPVPAGQSGHRVLATNLNFYTLPMIRFALDDRITISPEPCSCGNPATVIESIDGRTDDIFWLDNTKGKQVPIHPCAFEPPLIGNPLVQEYQIVHDSANHIVINIATGEANGSLSKNLPKIFQQHLKTLALEKTLEVKFSFSKTIPRQVSGKFRRFVSMVSPL